MLFPASWKTTPRIVTLAGALVRSLAASSFVVIDKPSACPPWSSVDNETGKSHGNHGFLYKVVHKIDSLSMFVFTISFWNV